MFISIQHVFTPMLICILFRMSISITAPTFLFTTHSLYLRINVQTCRHIFIGNLSITFRPIFNTITQIKEKIGNTIGFRYDIK